jgi:hypothetical protein
MSNTFYKMDQFSPCAGGAALRSAKRRAKKEVAEWPVCGETGHWLGLELELRFEAASPESRVDSTSGDA